MSEDIEGTLEYLDSKQENAPVSLMAHASETILKVVDFGADRPIDYFEPFSYIVKEERQPETDPLLALHEQKGPDFVEATKTKALNITQIFPKQKLTAEGEEEEEDKPEENEGEEPEEKHEEEEELNNEGEVPNVIADNNFLQNVGIGLNQREIILLQESIKKLVKTKPIQVARYWGKIQGAQRDYYVVEVEFNDGERPHAEANEEEEQNEEATPKEKKAPVEEDVGPNLYNYFVCTSLGGKWTLLPDVTPQQIVASRSIKQMFTGNLKAEVIAPTGRFEGTEMNLLRVVIARIVHSTSIAPKGLFNPEEEPEEDQPLESNAAIVQEEEWTPKPISGLSGFVHKTPCILPQGRCEFWAPEPEEEDEPEVPVEKGPPILRPLTEDEPLEGCIPSWSFRTVNVTHKLYWLRSNTWPGLNILSTDNGDKIVTTYYGWGMKSTQPLEWPPLPEPKKKIVPVEEEEEEEEEEDHGEKQNGEEEDKTEGDESAPTDGKDAANAPAGDDAASESTYETGTYDGSTYDGSTA